MGMVPHFYSLDQKSPSPTTSRLVDHVWYSENQNLRHFRSWLLWIFPKDAHYNYQAMHFVPPFYSAMSLSGCVYCEKVHKSHLSSRLGVHWSLFSFSKAGFYVSHFSKHQEVGLKIKILGPSVCQKWWQIRNHYITKSTRPSQLFSCTVGKLEKAWVQG